MYRRCLLTRIVIFFTVVLYLYSHVHGQPQQPNAANYDTTYLLHVKNFRAYYFRYFYTPKDSPLHVLSRDTMLIEVNDTTRYLSPGIKKEPDFNFGIGVDVVQVVFPRGTNLSVRFSTQVSRHSRTVPLAWRTHDTTFQISSAENNLFYFTSYRYISKFGRRPLQFYWRLYHNNNTRKHLARRLRKKLNTNIVHTIKIE